jgi:multidrug efflux pump subunit AcrA (membrane-fusion protein)
LVAAAVLITWATTRKGSSSTASAVTVSTQKVTVATGTIKQTVSASGTIVPASQANLSFAVSGQVTGVDVAVGQKVTVGQTLATVNATALQDDVNAATETLTADQARLSSDQSSGASTSQIDSDQAAVTSAQSQLATANQNLADAKLTSTIAGTVASVNLTVGQETSSGGSSSSAASNGGTGSGSGGSGAGGSGSTANNAQASSTSSSSSSSAQIVVVSTNSYNVDATVDDTQIGQVKVGDQATMVPGSSTATVYGTVSSVGLVAQSSGSSSSVASFPVVISVTGTPSGLFAGSSATVSIITEQLNNVVEVPTSAISYSNGQATVTRVGAGGQVSQPVTTGAAASGETQITSGLTAGDVVIERVVKFNGSTGAGRNLLGGGTGTRGTGGTRGAGFPGGAGGAGGAGQNGGGFAGFGGGGG